MTSQTNFGLRAIAATASSGMIGLAAASPLQFVPPKTDGTMSLETRTGCEQLYAMNCQAERSRLSLSFRDANGTTFVAAEQLRRENISHDGAGRLAVQAAENGRLGLDTKWNAEMRTSRLEIGRSFKLAENARFQISAAVGQADANLDAMARVHGQSYASTIKVPNTTTPLIDTTGLNERGIPQLGIAPGVIPAVVIQPRNIDGRDVQVQAASVDQFEAQQKQASSLFGTVRMAGAYDPPMGARSRFLMRSFANAGYEYSNAGIGVGFAVGTQPFNDSEPMLDRGSGGVAYLPRTGLTFSYQLQGMRVLHDRVYSAGEKSTDRFAARQRDRLVTALGSIDNPQMQAAMPQIRNAALAFNGQMVRDTIEWYDPRGKTHLSHNVGLSMAMGNGGTISAWYQRGFGGNANQPRANNLGVTLSMPFE